jgi:uncharacterized protein (DUF1015 family)
MADIYPFRAIRAPRDKVGLVASRSYINYSKADLRQRLSGNPYTFLHVLNPGFIAGIKLPRSRKERFQMIRESLNSFINANHLRKDEAPAFYVYRQDGPCASFSGIICGFSVDDYYSGCIKIHEQTLTRRELLFKQYLEITRFNAEPVLLTHPPLHSVDQQIVEIEKHFPDYDFRTTDTIRHRLWVIQNPAIMASIQEAYRTLDSVYVADGHHRSASSALLALSDRKKNKATTGSKMFMALNVPDNQLRIMAFDRLVQDVGNHSPEEFIEKLRYNFEVIPVASGFRPLRLHEFGMVLDGKWYHLKTHQNDDQLAHETDALDTKILTRLILKPILGIHNQKNDPRIAFEGGYEDVDHLTREMKKRKFRLGFTLFPVSIDQLKAVANAGEIMPPKSTWIEPKLRSGLTIMDLDEEI